MIKLSNYECLVEDLRGSNTCFPTHEGTLVARQQRNLADSWIFRSQKAHGAHCFASSSFALVFVCFQWYMIWKNEGRGRIGKITSLGSAVGSFDFGWFWQAKHERGRTKEDQLTWCPAGTHDADWFQNAMLPRRGRLCSLYIARQAMPCIIFKDWRTDAPADTRTLTIRARSALTIDYLSI